MKNCEKCKKMKRNKPDNEFECYYSHIARDFLGDDYSHIDCPDINKNNTVDLLFSSGNEYVEVELKRIAYVSNDANFIAHDKYMNKIISQISDIIDCEYDLFIDVAFKNKINGLKFSNSVLPLVNNITNVDYENLPETFENNDIKIFIDYLDESNCGSIASGPLIFQISNPIIENSIVYNPSIDEIKNELVDYDYFTNEIINYISDSKFRDKFSLNDTRKIAMFVINHSIITNSLIPSFNKIQNCDLVEMLLNYQIANIDLKSNFLDNLIIVHEDIETQELRYVVI